jgi:Zn-dependent protease
MDWEAISIGKIFGVEVDLHWTFILLLLFSLLISTFFFILIVLLFVCVLIHELAHSITSIRNKVKVKKIILLPIGGLSIMEDKRIDPRVELNMALAGPLMSLFLGCVFGVLVIFTPAGSLTLLFQLLFELNILMGVFNLLPAFPMDGGRVFRSYLQRKHNFFDATMITVKLSEYLMDLIIVGTVIFLVFPSSYSLSYREFIALWNIIIVFFLYSGAEAEKQNAIMRRETMGLRLRDAKKDSYVFVSPDLHLNQLYPIVKKRKEHLLITKIGNDYAFVDLFRKIKGKNIRYVRDVAVKIPEASERTSMADALSKMQSVNTGVLAIVNKGKLEGVTTASLIQAMISLHMIGSTSKK